MADIPDDELEATRNALAPTLDATAAVLPWLAKTRAPRFDKKLNTRWIEASQRLAAAWSERHTNPDAEIRPPLFALYSIALETGDADCLTFGEALAEAADQLENGETPHLVAALSAAIESLVEAEGLEHPTFPERAQHFANRLANVARLTPATAVRSPTIDRLFVDEATEHIEQMRYALAVLPPDAYALKNEAESLRLHAEQLELWGIVRASKEFSATLNAQLDHLDQLEVQDELSNQIEALASLIAAVLDY